MSLFTIQKVIEQTNKPKFTYEDFVFTPMGRPPRSYVPPDYSPLYFIGVIGFCIVVALFFSALHAKNRCEAWVKRGRSPFGRGWEQSPESTFDHDARRKAR